MPTTERVTPPPPVARGLPVVGVLPEFAIEAKASVQTVSAAQISTLAPPLRRREAPERANARRKPRALLIG